MLDETLLKKVMGTVLKVDPSSLGDDSSIDSIPTWDSLRHMNMVLALEDEFGVAIPDNEAAFITSYPLVRRTMRRLLDAR
ncbi:MAG: acyl carrier protein [Casimicrobiaceae bacterium]